MKIQSKHNNILALIINVSSILFMGRNRIVDYSLIPRFNLKQYNSILFKYTVEILSNLTKDQKALLFTTLNIDVSKLIKSIMDDNNIEGIWIYSE